MSVYTTPTKTCFDEGFSPCSNQSLYFTPRESFSYLTPQTRSRKRATPYRGKVPKFNVYNEELSPPEENSRKDNVFTGVSSPIPISVRDNNKWSCHNAHSAKETLISIDKENIGVRFCSTSTPSLPVREPPNGCFTPLRNISNQPNEKNASATVFEARISSIGKHFDLRIRTEADVDQPTKCSVVQKSPIFTPSRNIEPLITPPENEASSVTKKNGTLFRGFGLGRKLRRKSVKSNSKTVQKFSTMVDTLTQTDNEVISERFSKDVGNTDVPRIQDQELRIKNEISTLVINSQDNSRTPLLVEKKTPPRKVRFWQFIKVKRFRLSPVKRLFSKPTRYLVSFKEKIAKSFSLHPIKNLLNLKPEDISRISVESNAIQTHQICTLCLENLSTKEEATCKALSALMTKLSSMEEELKEIKGFVRNNANSAQSQTRNCLLPPLPPMAPPPPPPPPPPNFLNSTQSTGTLKRKADLTTPENVNHVVKKPAIKNEKTQFSITVEDLRSIKLRKTPAHVFKPRETKESSTANGDEAIRSSRLKKNRKSIANGKTRTQSLAELSSRENVTINRSSIIDSSTPVGENLSTICILEQTPVTSKNTLTNNRSLKRKEWLIESPIRKRANTGNNSSIYCDAESEY